MLILAIDTSCFRGGVGVFEEGIPIFYLPFPEERKHIIYLPIYIQRVLEESRKRLEDIDLIAVALGPGSFTGVRVGLAVAKSMSYALSKPIKGVPSLDALASNFKGEIVLPTIKVRKNQYVGALFKGGIPPEKLSDIILGTMEAFKKDGILFLDESWNNYTFLMLKGVALLAKFLFEKNGSDDPFIISPIYIKGGQPC
ncbi:MAG: tRNA (adenosine(37)-N6)-threonylcarbamoyltransferase complex dimerization subunit type 1 TsaB [Synergistetes bacterium]|nr:tRNA (adenosine(37)-N6)-threonylcarbamoyltransferase complex dimerization subunit type 1 TsaB [Synergistota bacterium]